jgi:hypothetical protein
VRAPKVLKTAALVVVLAAPTLAAAAWTCWPALSAAAAALAFGKVETDEGGWQDPEQVMAIRRHVQKHFLDHAVYIPLEDIVVDDASDTAAGSLSLLMQKACGRGRLYVWIPLRFRLPALGEKVVEWCWKPPTLDP